MHPAALKTVNVTRYVTPLREGGSLPAIVEADDDGMYVLKFRGAGQGVKALIAELVAGELGRLMGLRVPDIVFANLDPILSRTEPDPEIQELLAASAGVNLGLDYLPGSITFDPVVDKVDPLLASKIVWLDAFVTNVDRTARNTNMLMWHKELWLIDHGAALIFQHAWDDWQAASRSSFAYIKSHVLLPFASELEKVDAEIHEILTGEAIAGVVSLIPDTWLDHATAEAEAKREIYRQFLETRLAASDIFVQEAQRARQSL